MPHSQTKKPALTSASKIRKRILEIPNEVIANCVALDKALDGMLSLSPLYQEVPEDKRGIWKAAMAAHLFAGYVPDGVSATRAFMELGYN